MKKLRARRQWFIAIFKNTLDGIAENCQHELLFRLQAAASAKYLTVLLWSDDVAFKKSAAVFHVRVLFIPTMVGQLFGGIAGLQIQHIPKKKTASKSNLVKP